MRNGCTQKTKAGIVAAEYCKKYASSSSLSIARALRKDHPKLYRDVDIARNHVRYLRGALGGTHRKKCTEIIPRFKIPESYNQDYSEYVITARKMLLIADLHIPYHDKPALMCALETGYRERCDTVVILGDLMDCHTLSRFSRDPEARIFPEEVEATKAFLTMLKKNFKHVIYKLGNHEERYEHYMMQHAPEIFNTPGGRLDHLLDLGKMGVEFIGQRRVMRAGYLHLIHGHEYTGGTINPVNPARGLFLRSKGICVQGHNHQTSEHTEPTIGRDIITDWSIGCLCFLHPQYSPLNRWNHGAAIVSLKPDGSFNMRNFRIRNGKVL